MYSRRSLQSGDILTLEEGTPNDDDERAKAERLLKRLDSKMRKKRVDAAAIPFVTMLHELITRSVQADFSPWPAQSPDLSPIENVWRIVKRAISKQPIARSVVDLQQQVEDVWDSIPLHIIQTLIDSMPRHIAAVIAEKGGHTKY
jgi:hypothetical protein